MNCVQLGMADKENYEVALHRVRKTYEFETLLTYYPVYGGKGWVIKNKKKRNEDIQRIYSRGRIKNKD